MRRPDPDTPQTLSDAAYWADSFSTRSSAHRRTPPQYVTAARGWPLLARGGSCLLLLHEPGQLWLFPDPGRRHPIQPIWYLQEEVGLSAACRKWTGARGASLTNGANVSFSAFPQVLEVLSALACQLRSPPRQVANANSIRAFEVASCVKRYPAGNRDN